jgi:hypothetical protein
MPFGVIDMDKIKNRYKKLTDEEQQIKEEYITKLYNLKKPHNKIFQANKENKYLGYYAIDNFGKRYEIKSVNHNYMEFKGEYFGILKLGFCNEKGLRIIYHYLNDELYYIDYSGTAFKNRWLKNSNKAGFIYIPVDASKNVETKNVKI